MTFFALILIKKFIFNSRFYIHMEDCAMGAVYAPAYSKFNLNSDIQKFYIFNVTQYERGTKVCIGSIVIVYRYQYIYIYIYIYR